MRIQVRAVWVAAFAVFIARAPRLAANDQVRVPEKRAVLIGINDYTASSLPAPATAPPPDRDWEDLQGAVTDAGILRDLLISGYGFDPANIVTLTDQQATRAAILDALERNLVESSKNGDVVFFYYSGHGSQVENSCSDEPDHMDESIVPADSRHGAADIRDKELRRIFNDILNQGTRLTVVFDSCHSGSGARGFDAGLRPRSVRPDLRDVADDSDPGPRPENRGALIVAAAQDFDLAYETREPSGNVHGAFSWAFEKALRDSVPGEPAIDTFLRAQARLRLDMPAQEPMIAGTSEARLTPFLGASGERPRRKTPIAVERVNPDGTYVLQGGWVNGINIGSELEADGIRLEVTALRGIARCDARAVLPVTRAAPAALQSGALLEIVGWAAPPGRPLRVWIPAAVQETAAFAQELQREAERTKIQWVADPTETVATHLVRWRDGQWEVLARGKRAEHAGGVDPAHILRGIPPGSSVFVQLPAPVALVEAIGVRPNGDQDGIELTSDPQLADYILGGRLVDGRIEYTWLRRAMTPSERGLVALPLRSRWSSADAADTPLVLHDAILRLRRIFGWQHLESPRDDALPYDLAIRRADDGSLVKAPVLVGESRYGLVLRARSGRPVAAVQPRYVYVFAIDSLGNSILLFPPSGSVENRVPIADDEGHLAQLPSEIPLGERASFSVTPPYGIDTYFLLTTDEALPDPWSLEWSGVRAVSGRGTSPLQQLLALGGTMRSPLRTPSNWSIEKLVFESVSPQAAHKSGGALQ
ncbi:MAG: peptidase caspase catalytic subunit p20 [Acidobacteria bacterium]|nr:peptidase caspase catalytic subunit p20 [Acidobacteriota bacterium]